MKKLFLLIFLLFSFINCGSLRKIENWENIGTDGSSMVEIFDKKITYNDFLVICQKDTLSVNLEEWLEMVFYNSQLKPTKQWLYIKDTDTCRVYTLTMSPDSVYKLNIRDIIIENKNK